MIREEKNRFHIGRAQSPAQVLFGNKKKLGRRFLFLKGLQLVQGIGRLGKRRRGSLRGLIFFLGRRLHSIRGRTFGFGLFRENLRLLVFLLLPGQQRNYGRFGNSRFLLIFKLQEMNTDQVFLIIIFKRKYLAFFPVF